MVKISGLPPWRKQSGVIYYNERGIAHARPAKNNTDYGKIPPTSFAQGTYINQRQQQTFITQIRGSISRNFARWNQNTQTRPDYRWNSGFSRHLWLPPFLNPRDLQVPRWFYLSFPERHWIDSISHFGLWHKWQQFAAFYETAKKWNLESEEWGEFRNWFTQYCRWRWDAGRFMSPDNPGGVMNGDKMCAYSFAVLNFASYPTPESAEGLPPDWCQYAQTPSGAWASICFNPIVDGFHRCDCKPNGKPVFSNNYNFSDFG